MEKQKLVYRIRINDTGKLIPAQAAAGKSTWATESGVLNKLRSLTTPTTSWYSSPIQKQFKPSDLTVEVCEITVLRTHSGEDALKTKEEADKAYQHAIQTNKQAQHKLDNIIPGLYHSKIIEMYKNKQLAPDLMETVNYYYEQQQTSARQMRSLGSIKKNKDL